MSLVEYLTNSYVAGMMKSIITRKTELLNEVRDEAGVGRGIDEAF